MSARQVQLGIKRASDLLIGFTAMVVLAPLLLLLALWIRLDSRGPALFVQPRLGQRGKSFRLLKFRTMVEGAESMGPGLATARDDPRITRTGRVLRWLSLDELPQLINVVRGDMSLVGPRPAPVEHLQRYSERDKQRLEMRPGMTGWAQIHGRNLLTWPERIEKDIWYIRNHGLLLDMSILIRTIMVVLSSKGIYSGRHESVTSSTGVERGPKE